MPGTVLGSGTAVVPMLVELTHWGKDRHYYLVIQLQFWGMLQRKETQSPESQQQGFGIWSPAEVTLSRKPVGQKDREELPRWREGRRGQRIGGGVWIAVWEGNLGQPRGPVVSCWENEGWRNTPGPLAALLLFPLFFSLLLWWALLSLPASASLGHTLYQLKTFSPWKCFPSCLAQPRYNTPAQRSIHVFICSFIHFFLFTY